MRDAARLLEPYRALMRDEHHGVLTRRLLDWSLQYASPQEDPSVLAQRAYISSTFEVDCCPPQASLDENLLGAMFLVCLFTVDDGPDEALSAFLAPAGGASSSTVLQARHDSWLEELHRKGRDTLGPRAAFRELCAWMRVERGLDTRTMTEARYREVRRYTIAVPAYAACWASIRGLTPSERAGEALRRSELVELASELAYLTNDLGSLERDEEAARQHSSSGEPNLILLRARELGSREEAIRQVSALYRERVEDFRRRRAELAESEHWRERSVRDFVEQLRRAVNGNVHTTRHLMATRYPGAQALLDGLPEVEPLEGNW